MSTEKEIYSMINSTNNNGWQEWAKYVLMSLEDLKAQNTCSEKKIDENKDAFIRAINTLELNVTREINEVRSDIAILKTRFAVRTVAWSSIIPGIVGGLMLLIKYLG
jgi:hypothetical protein